MVKSKVSQKDTSRQEAIQPVPLKEATDGNHEKYHERGLTKILNMSVGDREKVRSSLKNPNMPVDEWFIQFGKEATGGEVHNGTG